MEWLILLGLSGAAAGWYFFFGPGAQSQPPHPLTPPPSGTNVAPSALGAGHWYRISLQMIGKYALPDDVTKAVTSALQAQGFIGALGVVPIASTAPMGQDQSAWLATASGQYIGGQGGVWDVPAFHVLSVEEVAAPTPGATPAAAKAVQTPPKVSGWGDANKGQGRARR